MKQYDAFLLVSFGGPEGPDDVLPFLRNVTRGRGVPQERLAEVAEHYRRFGGVSPINEQCRDLLRAVRELFASEGPDLPIYWGNRNWHPYLTETVERMRADGVRRALAFVTSPYGSYSSCRQYQDDIAAARAEVGDGAPVIDKIRHYHDHPGYIAPHADAVRAALATLPARDRPNTRLVFTAHSIPTVMAESAGAATMAALTGRPVGGRYEAQLREVAGIIAGGVGGAGSGGIAGGVGGAGLAGVAGGVGGAGSAGIAGGLPWDLVWQSRSGPPQVPWLGPDINEHLDSLARAGTTGVVVSPIGFISDHLEVVWDLDNEAADTAKALGLDFVRAATPGTDPRFVAMVRELVLERIEQGHQRRALGKIPTWDYCDAGCCAAGRRGVVTKD